MRSHTDAGQTYIKVTDAGQTIQNENPNREEREKKPRAEREGRVGERASEEKRRTKAT